MKKLLDKLTFELLLKQAIFDYKESNEDDERNDIIHKLIDELENPEIIK